MNQTPLSESKPAGLVPGEVTPTRALQWIARGWTLFMQSPVIWIIHTLIVFVILTALSLLPLLGWAAAPIALPLLLAGMLSGAQAIDRGESLRIDHLFDGIRRQPGPLLLVGSFHLLGALLAAMAAAAISGSAVLGGVVVGALPGVGVAAAGVMFGVLVFSVLWALLMMGLWFAPALVMLDEATPLQALSLSVRTCFANLLTFIVLAGLLYVLIWVAMLPAGLGMLVLVPVLACALYASWQDSFVPKLALPSPAAPPTTASSSAPPEGPEAPRPQPGPDNES